MSDFGTHFAALMGRVLDAPTDIEPQKESLRALRVQSRLAAHHIGLDDRGRVVADGVPLDAAAPGVTALASQLSGHHLARLDFEADVTPAELLTVARLLAEPPAAERPGHVFSTRLDGNAITQVIPTVARSERPPVPQATAPAFTPVFGGEDATSLLFAAVRAPTGSAEELLERIHATRDVNGVTRLLDEYCSVVERAHMEQRADQVVNGLAAIVDGEEREQHAELKLAWSAAFRRLGKPTLLTFVAASMVHRRERMGPSMRILVRAGSGGWEALLTLLRNAQGQYDRSIYTDALTHHQPPVEALITALHDFPWFAVRNVCELLGELGFAEAVPQLIATLNHADERVRLAAAVALARLGTTASHRALQQRLGDASPAIRLMAAQAFATLRTDDATRLLIAARDAERDGPTEAALLTLIGKSGTPLALQYLVNEATPSKRLFGRKPVQARIGAVRAMAELRTPDAIDMLRAFGSDKDQRVADAAKLAALMADRRSRPITDGTLAAIRDV